MFFGLSLALLVRAGLGLDPWDVFHQGLARRTGQSLGTIVIVVSALVLLLWIPLRQRPGAGTVANALLVGLFVDVGLALTPEAANLPSAVAMLVLAVLVNAVATGLYIGAGLGPGTRDGLMTGLVAKGHSVRVVRTTIELAVLGVGWALGGDVGIGTAVYALTIGPLVHLLLPRLTIRTTPVTPAAEAHPCAA